MPEGDTIFRSARTLHRALAGRVVTGFDTGYAHLARGNDDAPLVGRTVERVEARGKWLLMYFSGDLILLSHMLMNGSWHIYRAGERWRRKRGDMRIVVKTGEWEAVGFTVPIAEFHFADSLARKTAVLELGPDLLKQDFDADAALARMREQGDEEIAVVLLNQRVLAGIGNVFKSEICFACGVHPFRRADELSQADLEALVHTSRKFLTANVADGTPGQIVTYTGPRRTTHSSDPSARLWVYGRRGESCRRCGGAIHMRKQGTQARATFWCPSCQPMTEQVSAQGNAAAIEGWTHVQHGAKMR